MIDQAIRRTNTTTVGAIAGIPRALIRPGPWQPRRRFDQAGLDELAESIRQHGILTPLVVRPDRLPAIDRTRAERGLRTWVAEHIARQIIGHSLDEAARTPGQPVTIHPGRTPREWSDAQEAYRLIAAERGLIAELGPAQPTDSGMPGYPLTVYRPGEGYQIVAGERRWRAATLAGLDVLPCRVVELSDDTALHRLALLDNLHREDLRPGEEASVLRALADSGLSQREIAEQIGKSQPWVAQRLNLLKLPAVALERLDSAGIGIDDARELLKLQQFPALITQVLDDARPENSYDRFDRGQRTRALRPVRDRIKDVIDQRARDEEKRQALEKLQGDGKQVVEDWQGYGDRRFLELYDDSEDARIHDGAALPCVAWCWTGSRVLRICTDPAAFRKARAAAHAQDPVAKAEAEETRRERARQRARDEAIAAWLRKGEPVNPVDLAEALYWNVQGYADGEKSITRCLQLAGLAEPDDRLAIRSVADRAHRENDLDRLLQLWFLCHAALPTGVYHWAQDWLRSIGYRDPTLILNSLADRQDPGRDPLAEAVQSE